MTEARLRVAGLVLAGGGSIRGWLAFDDAMAFFNVNDPASLLQLQRSLRGEGKQSG